MGGGEHGPGSVEAAGGEVEEVGGGQPQVDDGHPFRAGAEGEGLRQFDPGVAHVPGHQQGRRPGEAGDGHPDGPEHGGVELIGDDTADVVGLEHVGEAGHGRAILSSPPAGTAGADGGRCGGRARRSTASRLDRRSPPRPPASSETTSSAMAVHNWLSRAIRLPVSAQTSSLCRSMRLSGAKPQSCHPRLRPRRPGRDRGAGRGRPRARRATSTDGGRPPRPKRWGRPRHRSVPRPDQSGVGRQFVDHGAGIGVVGQPLFDPEPVRCPRPSPSSARPRARPPGDPGHRSRFRSLVTAAHLGAAGDEDHPEAPGLRPGSRPSDAGSAARRRGAGGPPPGNRTVDRGNMPSGRPTAPSGQARRARGREPCAHRARLRRRATTTRQMRPTKATREMSCPTRLAPDAP